MLQKKYPEVKSLRNATMDMLSSVRNELDETVYNRCSYVIQEKTRVLEAIEAGKTVDKVFLQGMKFRPQKTTSGLIGKLFGLNLLKSETMGQS